MSSPRHSVSNMKASEQPIAPRKLPSQSRARASVNAILQAARSIIIDKGFENASTNYIAEVAGVSIGTVYQYFPRKEAILAALLEQDVVRHAGPLRQCMLDNLHRPLEECLPRVIGLVLEARKASLDIVRGLHSSEAQFGDDAHLLTPESFLHTTTKIFWEEHKAEIKIENLEIVDSVIEYMVVGAMNLYLNDPSPKLTDSEFTTNLADAVLRYLTA